MEGVAQTNARATVQAGHTLKERRTSREDSRSTLVYRNCREAEDLKAEPRKGANDVEDAFNRCNATHRGENTLQETVTP